jgi:hypothetical protein
MKKLIFLILLLAGMSFGQTTVAPFLSSKIQLLDNSGVVCSGCLLDTFAAGTTTPLATYSESTGTSLNANPVVLDSAGRATVYLTSASYKFRLRSALGVTLWTQDVISWTTQLTTFPGIIDTGDLTLQQSTAATNVANQSSNNIKVQARYWTGSADATETCNLQDVLGTGSNPTVAFTLTCSGSSGATSFSVVPNTAFLGTVSVTGVTTDTGGLNIGKVIRDARQDGVKCDGTTDDSAAITLSLVNAYAAGQGAVQLPSGQCKVNTTINDTNKPNLDVYGSNSNEDWSTTTTNQNFGTTLTQLLCNTGSTPCWDATGSGRARLMNFGLRAAAGYTSPSQIGFMFGRDNAVSGPAWTTGTGTFCFAQENKLENVWVYFDTRPAATAVGTVAVYNVGAEQFQILGGGYIADNPVFITATNDLSLASPYQTLATGCPASMTEVKVGHGASFQAWTRSAFDLRGVIDFESEKDTEILNGVIGTNHSPAVTINSGANVPTNITLQGQDEGFDFPLTLNTSVEGLDARLTAVAPTAAGLIVIGNGITVSDCYINMPQINGTIQPLVNILSGTATMRGCIIFEGKNLGTGAGAANVTLTNSTIYAPGLTDTQVNTFKAGSSYDVFDSTGRSFVGGNKYIESTAPSAVAGSDVCYGDSTAHAIECSFNNGPFFPMVQARTASGSTVRVASDFTTANNTSLQAITGLSWTFPAVAGNYSFHCAGTYSQATANVAVNFGIQAATNNPTNIMANGQQQLTVGTPATFSTGTGVTNLSTTTATAIVAGVPGATATGYTFYLDGTLELPASANTINIMVSTAAGADAVTVKRGSYCTLY